TDFVAEEHAFDLPSPPKTQQQLFGTVVGLRVADDLRSPEIGRLGEILAHALAEIAHWLPARDSTNEQPPPHLPGTKRRQPSLCHPGGELAVDVVEQVNTRQRETTIRS